MNNNLFISLFYKNHMEENMININENEMATKLLKKIICETIINILNENNTSKYYFIVERMLNKPININMNLLTKHFNNDRKNRLELCFNRN